MKTRHLSVEDLRSELAEVKALLAKEKEKKPRRRKSNDEVKYFTQEQTEAFFRAIKNPRDMALFRVAYHHGLRASEVGLLQLSHYRVKSGRIFITRLKGSNSGEYKMPKSARRALDAWLQIRGYDDGPLFPARGGGRPFSKNRPGSKPLGISDQTVNWLMHKYGAAAGLPTELCHPHTMKHSCAVHLLEGGPGRPRMDIVAVQDWLGHVNIASTMVYAKITNRVRDEVGSQIGSW